MEFLIDLVAATGEKIRIGVEQKLIKEFLSPDMDSCKYHDHKIDGMPCYRDKRKFLLWEDRGIVASWASNFLYSADLGYTDRQYWDLIWRVWTAGYLGLRCETVCVYKPESVMKMIHIENIPKSVIATFSLVSVESSSKHIKPCWTLTHNLTKNPTT
jgi:hypothetical protein